jgi:hypothetical protein
LIEIANAAGRSVRTHRLASILLKYWFNGLGRHAGGAASEAKLFLLVVKYRA